MTKSVWDEALEKVAERLVEVARSVERATGDVRAMALLVSARKLKADVGIYLELSKTSVVAKAGRGEFLSDEELREFKKDKG